MDESPYACTGWRATAIVPNPDAHLSQNGDDDGYGCRFSDRCFGYCIGYCMDDVIQHSDAHADHC